MPKQEILPETKWRNRILAEKPFGPDQAAVDKAAEAIYLQGVNEYLVIDVTGDDWVIYREVGTTGPNSKMTSGQFLRDFELIH